MNNNRLGLTIRACPSEFAVPVKPIDVPVEPLPLDETNPIVNLLGDADENDFETDRNESNAGEPYHAFIPDESVFRRRLKRNASLLSGNGLFVFFWIAWTSYAFSAIPTWRISLSLVFWTGLLAFLTFGLGVGGAWRWRQQWLIVPGGLIARKSNWRGQWVVHLFDRRTSVLCAYRQSKNHWFICVADSHTDQTASITPTESLALLRAWLSPLPPPPVEQLGELAG